MTYVYGCDDGTRQEVSHGMMENPTVVCPTCGHPMHRVPQAFRFYLNPGQHLMDKLDRQYRDYRNRKANHGTQI